MTRSSPVASRWGAAVIAVVVLLGAASPCRAEAPGGGGPPGSAADEETVSEPASGAPSRRAADDEETGGLTIAGGILLGFGGAFLLTGTITHLVELGVDADADAKEEDCIAPSSDPCHDEAERARQSADALGWVSTGFAISAAAFSIAGLAMLLSDSSSNPTSSAQASLVVGPDGAFMHVNWRF